MKNNKKILILFGIIVLFVFVGVGVLKSNKGSNNQAGASQFIEKTKLTVYKSPSCGCCVNYVAYLRREGFDVEVIEVSNKEMADTKQLHGVPGNMSSCHTAVMGDYVVEGHIPAKAITKLASERPAIRGIAMPGMPAGSPGMPGTKNGSFSIYGIDDSGNTSLFIGL